MKAVTASTLLMLSLLTFQVNAQLNLNGEIRPRTELRYGYKTLPIQGQEPAFLISQRVRFGAIYKKNNLETKLTLQNASIWGDEQNVIFYEAWVKYHLSAKWNLTIGRQELQYDGGRLIAARNRRQEGFYYDAIIAKYAHDSLYVDLSLSVNNNQENLFGNAFANPTSQFKNFSFAYAKKYFDNGLIANAMAINSGFQKENSDTVYYKQTIGTEIIYSKNKFSVGGEAYYQIGKHKDGRAVNAYLTAVNVGYEYSSKVKVTLTTEYTSGVDINNTDATYQSKMHNFDILEGARFAYWGNANIFRNLESHTKKGGLTAFYSSLILKPTKKSNIALTYYQFALSNDVVDENSQVIKRNLGGELDLLARYKVYNHTTLSLGYSLMLPTNSWEFVQNIPQNTSATGHYLWLMMTSKLQFL